MKKSLVILCILLLSIKSQAQEKLHFGSVFLSFPLVNYTYHQNLQSPFNKHHSLISMQSHETFGLHFMLSKKLGFYVTTSLNYIEATIPDFDDYFNDYSPENPLYVTLQTQNESISAHFGLSYIYLNRGIISLEIKGGYVNYRKGWLQDYANGRANFGQLQIGDEYFNFAALHIYSLIARAQGFKNSFECTHNINLDLHGMRFSFFGGFGFLQGGLVNYRLFEKSSFNQFEISGSTKVNMQSNIIVGFSLKKYYSLRKNG